jgi:hypothetical protein
MKKFLIAGSSLAAVAAAGSAGAVDVTLGGSIEMSVEYGLGKDVAGMAFDGSSVSQTVALNIAAAGTTDGGMKFGGSFGISTAEELKLNPYTTTTADGDTNKYVFKHTNPGEAAIHGTVYAVSGGEQYTAGEIVSVKINSEWHNAGDSFTDYDYFVSMDTDSGICKMAGIALNNGTAYRSEVDQDLEIVAGDYMPAGEFVAATESDEISITAETANGDTNIAANTEGTVNVASVDYATNDGETVGDGTADVNEIFVGPFAEVILTSSTTKMVVGAVCIEGEIDASETAVYVDVATRVMHVGNASIFLEGGFGKLTLQQGDYAGKVGAIGAAGDEATVESSGLVAVLDGASALGVAGYAAVDVGSIALGSRPNYMLGTSVDLMGLTIAVEMEDEQPGDEDEGNTYIDNWDMGTSYAIGDMTLNAALDSDGDWAVKASAAVAGFSATSVIENVGAGANAKSGLSIDTTLATNFNGIGVSIGLDENLAYTLSGSYSLGNSGLALSASYSSAKSGGKVSAKLSF